MRAKQVKAVLIAAALATPALAAPALARNVTADPELIAEVMQKAGYRTEVIGKQGEERYIRSGVGGHTFGVIMFGCDDTGEACKTIQLYAGFATDDPPSLELMNAYAAQKRWGRVYLDDEDDPVIEMDIDLEDGGVSEELFLDNLEYWEVVINQFATFTDTKEIP